MGWCLAELEVCKLTLHVIDLRHQRRKGLGSSVCGVLSVSLASVLDLLFDPGHLAQPPRASVSSTAKQRLE